MKIPIGTPIPFTGLAPEGISLALTGDGASGSDDSLVAQMRFHDNFTSNPI